MNPVWKKSKKEEKEMAAAEKRVSLERMHDHHSKQIDVKSELFPKINTASYKFYGQFERDPLLAAEEESRDKPIMSQTSSLQDSIFSKIRDATTKNFAEKV